MSSSVRQGEPGAAAELSEVVERPSPGIAALLEGVSEDRTHSVLDLGSAASPTLEVYRRFARWVRFAGVLDQPVCDSRELEHLRHTPEPPYDLVFAWDVLDRVAAEQRRSVVQKLAEVTAPNARLHLLVNTSVGAEVRRTRFRLVGIGRMRCEPSGPPGGPAPQQLLAAEVERLLRPFRVIRGFTLRPRIREYVAVRAAGRPHRGVGDSTRHARGGDTAYLGGSAI